MSYGIVLSCPVLSCYIYINRILQMSCRATIPFLLIHKRAFYHFSLRAARAKAVKNASEHGAIGSSDAKGALPPRTPGGAAPKSPLFSNLQPRLLHFMRAGPPLGCSLFAHRPQP